MPPARPLGLDSFRMTMRVCMVDRYGAVTEERGTVGVPPSEYVDPIGSAYPPCRCRRCRTGAP